MKKTAVCILLLLFFTVSIFAENKNDFPEYVYDTYIGPTFPIEKNAYGFLWKLNSGVRSLAHQWTGNVGIMYGTGNAGKIIDEDKIKYYGMFKDYCYLEDSVSYPAMKEVRTTIVAVEILLGLYFVDPKLKLNVSVKSGLAYNYEFFQGKVLSDDIIKLGYSAAYSIPITMEIKVGIFEIAEKQVYIYLEPELWFNIEYISLILINANLGMEF